MTSNITGQIIFKTANEDWGFRALVAAREIGGFEVWVEAIRKVGQVDRDIINEPKGFADEREAIAHALTIVGK